ncbi:ABSCISIC ACID-INSENSITIVE 5-like protein 2 [Punica granatum]|uniref:ABSCISIC ACID-INSENSITIVE 5-like protein 2 n=1 Tax=Punica granatum TaxID=22663 RepID=A0A6P8C8Z6_PUNGR|nr:ABSCISIC ACID-INSENSITIVE 5-like protein 2 [Punica granatum]
MGSQGCDGGSGAEALEEQQRLQPLSQQGSLYSLTLDEVQNQLGGLGKPLGSMNLDELLRSVWSAESNTGPLGFDSNTNTSGAPQSGSIQSQGSFTLSRDLSKKTVDEVWRDIQQGKKKNKKKSSDGGGNEVESDNHQRQHQERQLTLGEMTLEDFLVKAGVVTEFANVGNTQGPISGVNPISAPQQAQQWMHYQLPSVQHQQPHQNTQKVMTVFVQGHPSVQQAVPIGTASILDMAYPDAQMTMSPSSLMGTLSDTQTPGRKRFASGEVVEKTVERRQKRMIKNRESAARSRARKQAYTHELENKVSRLEEENERLKRQREAEKVVPSAPPPEPKNKLCRTSSAPF